jgi:tetratricopeptide (TPR) repeat protein
VEEAVKSMNISIAIDPKGIEGRAYLNRGIALLALKRTTGALDSLEKCISVNPDIGAAYLLIILLATIL